MKSIECLSLTKHLTQVLSESPLKSAEVRDAHAELERMTTELARARLVRERASGEHSDASARVRDATPPVRNECVRTRALLVVEGVPLAPHATERGGHALSVLARAEVLLERGAATGVKLAALAAARGRLRGAVAVRSAARVAKHEASVAVEAAVERWTGAYVALRTAVEAVLRHEGLRKADLKQRLGSYFPKRGRRSAAEPSAPTAPSASAAEKPAA